MRQGRRPRAANGGTIAVHRHLARVVIPLVLTIAVVLSATPAGASPADDEGGFAARIAAERQRSGLHGFGTAGDLQTVARRHAQRMADEGRLHHNPNLESEVPGWSAVGENVGVGYDVDELHQMFMDSSPHRANILHSAFTQVGVGVVWSRDGRLWVVEVFRRPSAAATPTTPAPPPVAPAPLPSPPTTLPPPPTATATTVATALVRPVAAPPTVGAEAIDRVTPLPMDAANVQRSVRGPAWLAAALIAAVGIAQLFGLRGLRRQ